MIESCTIDAVIAVIEIWAALTFVSDSIDVLVATVTNSRMGIAATGPAERANVGAHPVIGRTVQHQRMSWIMAMITQGETYKTEVVIPAIGAMSRHGLGKL